MNDNACAAQNFSVNSHLDRRGTWPSFGALFWIETAGARGTYIPQAHMYYDATYVGMVSSFA